MRSSSRTSAGWLCSLCVLAAGVLAAQAPPTVSLPDLAPGTLPFDLRQIEDPRFPSAYPPEAWCPSGPDFESWLESRKQPAGRAGWITPRGPGDPPTVWYDNGVIVMEDNGTLLRNDRPFDLPWQTLELVPSGTGYRADWVPLAYEPDVGAQVLTDRRQWMAGWLDFASFRFPFGGQDRAGAWVSPAIVLFFETPTPPSPDYLCTQGCFYDQGEVLVDRTPRVAPLQQGTSLYGWNVFFREDTDRAVFTWRATDGTWLDLDVQAVLFDDGRIRLNYRSVTGIRFGAPTVVTGNDLWWSSLTPVGGATDPAGDVAIPAPDGPAMDLVRAAVSQVAGSEVLQVELELANPIPGTTDEKIYYYVQIKDEADDETALRAVYFRWDNGAWTYRSQGLEAAGTTLRFLLNLLELPLADDDLFLDVLTFRGDAPYEYGDRVLLAATFAPPPGPVMLDLSADLPATVPERPIFEAFTYPELLPYGIQQALADALPDLRVDGMAAYQNFDTDIVFYAGGYHAGGNAGADGIGRGSSSEPETPSILHVNNVYRYRWLDWAMAVLTHEFAHRWLLFVRIEEAGVPTWSLNPGKAHPAAYVHMPAVEPIYRPYDFSCMGGSWWTDHGDGTFTSEPEDTGKYQGFTWDELYLMGLAAPWEVPDWWYIRDSAPPMPIAYWPPAGVTVSGTRVPVSLDQIVAVEGPRYPAYPDSRKDFVVPLVLVIRPGVVQQVEIDTVRLLCDYWSPVWARATGWRSTMRCAVSPPEVSITNPGAPPRIAPGTLLSFTGRGADPDGDAVELSWDFDGLAPGAGGPGPHIVFFPEEGIYIVTLSGRDSTGMPDPTPAEMVVRVECGVAIPPFEVERLRVAREDGSLRFTWWDLSTNPSDYILLRSTAAAGPFQPAASAPTGLPGLLYREREGGLVFYELAPWYEPGCLGPY